MVKKNRFQDLANTPLTILGLGFYLVVTSALLVACFSPDIFKIQLAPIDFAIEESFFVLALSPIMVYGTAIILRDAMRGVRE